MAKCDFKTRSILTMQIVTRKEINLLFAPLATHCYNYIEYTTFDYRRYSLYVKKNIAFSDDYMFFWATCPGKQYLTKSKKNSVFS
jgi:hypothetical protein